MVIRALFSGGFHSAAANATIGIVALAPNKASKQKVNLTDAPRSISRYVFKPAARVFYNRINPPALCARPETRLGTQAVLAALSRDPHGIAFVDAAAANDLLAAAPDKSGIKVLSIGAKGKAASPTSANVKAGKYPICRRLTLHVSPRASRTTRDFVKFILSGAADEVFTKHGLTTAVVGSR